MDDTCVTCAEILDWVAYGPCGHRDVCSTCVARSRFISHDRCCPICKTPSNVVFVTKDLGEYTKRIGDFSVLPSDVEEGRVGNYWYHEGTQAFFDDSDHYKMIKAMCELSCSVCDGIDKFRRKEKFKDIEELKGHLFHKHKLFMCSMCLEGKKVFICEQKLYTRAQLTRHINRGDEEVDGTEIDQGDFMGHPMCEFCSIPFYGESELYTHMSTEHHTCRMCLRQDAGQYEYYKNFSDLEAHFRRYHFLCEDEECLTKKFVVFLSEHELKLHTQEHEQDSLRRTECSCQHNTKDDELSLATQVSLETSNAAPSITGVDADHGEISNDNTHFPPLESLAITDSEPSLKCFQAMSQISFPPLPVAPCSSQQNGHFHALSQTLFPLLPVVPCSSQQNTRSDVLPKNTMASHLGRQRNNKMKISSPAPAWTPRNLNPAKPAIIPPHPWPSVNSAYGPLSSTRQNVTATENRPTPSSYAAAAKAHQSSRNCGNLSWDSYSTSSHNLSECVSFDPLITEFPPVSAVQTCKLPATVKKVKDVYTTNKSLVEKIRLALGFDENRYSTFKTISSEYRQGLMDAETYLVYMEQYGLLHLVHELVGLLPDERRQKELVETYNANLVDTARRENGWNNESLVKNDQLSKKDKCMSHDSRSNISKRNVIGTVKEVSAGYSRSQEDFEELSKEGYRVVKSKSKTLAHSQEELSKHGKFAKLKSCGAGSIPNFESGNGKRKQRKKSRNIRTNGPTAFA